MNKKQLSQKIDNLESKIFIKAFQLVRDECNEVRKKYKIKQKGQILCLNNLVQ